MTGGSNYRIIGVTTTDKKTKSKSKTKSKGKSKHKPIDENARNYILRIPRREKSNNTRLDREVAVLYYLETATPIPAPKTIAFDLDGINGCPIELPYVLQTRIAGMPLDEALSQMTFNAKKQFIRKLVDLYVEMDKIRFPCAGTLGSSLRRNSSSLEVTSFDLGPESNGNDRYRTHPQESTRDMLLSQFECWKIVADKGYHSSSSSQDELVSRYMDELTAVTLQMEKKGWLGDNKNILFHPELSPRHIFVTRTGSGSKAVWDISGVIDWEAALSVPRVMANRAPSWLWRWGAGGGYDEKDEKGDNRNPEDKEREILKHQFETEMAAALPKFLRYAYRPHFQLLRRLCGFAVWGLRWNEDIKKADEFLKEWKEVAMGSSRS